MSIQLGFADERIKRPAEVEYGINDVFTSKIGGIPVCYSILAFNFLKSSLEKHFN